jgi:hypothetical protein
MYGGLCVLTTDESFVVSAQVLANHSYQILAIDLEGTEVCDWLTPKGITCVLLKYRCPSPKLWEY